MSSVESLLERSGAGTRNSPTSFFSSSQRCSSAVSSSVVFALRSVERAQRFAVIGAGRRFALENLLFGVDQLDAAPLVLDIGWYGALAHADAGASGIQNADRFVGQLAGRNVPAGQPHGFDQRLVENADVVMRLRAS